MSGALETVVVAFEGLLPVSCLMWVVEMHAASGHKLNATVSLEQQAINIRNLRGLSTACLRYYI